jgi:hypothetical protein
LQKTTRGEDLVHVFGEEGDEDREIKKIKGKGLINY